MTEFTLPTTTVPSPMDAPPLRWGVISPGGIARKFVGTMHAATRSRLSAVCSRSLERAEDFARDFEKGGTRAAAFDSVEEFLASGLVDVVYVASPHGQHWELTRPVIEAGIPVVVEKAFTLNAGQALDLLSLAREKGVYVQEAMWSRYMPHYDVVRQVIEQGLIGEVTGVIADHGQYFPYDPEHRLFKPELGGGALLDLGVYPVAFAHWVAGAPEEITASGTLTRDGVDETISISAKSGRAVYSLQTTSSAQTSITAQVLGTEGKIEVDSWFYVPSSLTVTQWGDTAGAVARTARFTYEDSLPYAMPKAPEGTDYGMAFEIAEAARNITQGLLESERVSWKDTVEIMQFMDEVRAQVGVVYPQERSQG